jgi:hypothetical protein
MLRAFFACTWHAILLLSTRHCVEEVLSDPLLNPCRVYGACSMGTQQVESIFACGAECRAEHPASGAGKGIGAEHSRGGDWRRWRSARSGRQAALHLAWPHMDACLL